MTTVRTLVPLPGPPEIHPAAWGEAEGRGRGALAVVARPARPEAVGRLARAGASPLGRIELEYGTRPGPAVLAEITRWATIGVQGIFFDRAPADPYQIAPVAQAVRAARRAGLSTIVLNPGTPVDPIYRELDAVICSFEGSWIAYLAHAGEQFTPGDGHLVLDVPPEELQLARAMVVARGSGLFLVTGRSTVFTPATGAQRRPEKVHSG
jgi:spherulation-specific family 4 protein